jgi:subtilisin family serine protease
MIRSAFPGRWLLLAGWAIAALAHPARGNEVPTTITVRFVPNQNDARVLALLRRLARIGVPEPFTLAVGEDIEPVLRGRCGFVSDLLLRVIREQNPGVTLTALDRVRSLQLPPCPFWRFKGFVPVIAGGSLPDALELFIGSSSDRFVRQLVRGRSLAGKVKGDIVREDVRVPVAFTTEAVTIVLKEAFADDPDKVMDDLATGFPEFVPDQLRTSFFTQGGDANFALIETIVPASADAAEQECGVPPDVSRWPFDEALVAQILRENFARLGKIDPKASTIVVADTGIDSADEGWLLLRRDGSETGPLAHPHRDDDGNGYDDDVIGANLNPPPVYPQIEPAYAEKEHGTRVASVAQGLLRADVLREVLRGRLQLSIARVSGVIKTPGITLAWFDVASVLRSIKYAASIQAPVVNWSIESPRRQFELESQLLLTPSLLGVVAAGNSRTYLNQEPRYPAYLVKRFPDNLIVVAAHSADGKLWQRSSWGNEVVDLAAPGCSIEAAGFGGVRSKADGTSLAAPLVSFTAALLHAHGIDEPQDLKGRILAATEPAPSLADRVRSAGRLDIPKAIAVLDDVIVIRGAGGHPDRMLRGKIEDPLEWDLCGEINAIRAVAKLSPQFAKGPNPTRVMLKRPEGGHSTLFCEEPAGSVTFSPLVSAEPVRYGPPEVHPVASLLDVTPAFFPSP